MIRIVGVNIPDNKSILFGLMLIYGIGRSRAKLICNSIKINYLTKIKDLSEKNIELIRKFLFNFILEGDLRRENMLNIKRLVDLNCYRGIRYKKKLPVRGQRTRTNAKTCRKLNIYRK